MQRLVVVVNWHAWENLLIECKTAREWSAAASTAERSLLAQKAIVVASAMPETVAGRRERHAW